jgi:energy-coupling factor transporter ATP-binding protein EcfA2
VQRSGITVRHERLDSLGDGRVLQPPSELIAACVEGRCVAFVGSGLSTWSGYPAWRTALERLLAAARLSGNAARITGVPETFEEDDLGFITEVLKDAVSPDLWVSTLKTLYGEEKPLTAPLASLATIPFTEIVTTNFDTLIERAVAARNPEVVSLDGTLSSPVLGGRLSIVKLHGDIAHPEEIVISSDEVRQALRSNAGLSRALTSLWLSRTWLFLGTTPKEIDALMSILDISGELRSPAIHFALIPDAPMASLHAHRLMIKYGIEALQCSPFAYLREHDQFLQRLRDAMVPLAAVHQARVAPLQLSTVRLSNIGLFADIELELNGEWNVVLGSNAAGKSTLLRAIALGLAGDDPKAVVCAADLLRVGENRGFIELRVGPEVYRTELTREGSIVRVTSRQITPLQAGKWVVLGFPAVRGLSTSNISGPSSEGPSQPTVEDLLPLIQGVVDYRVDALKQWIVNLDVRLATNEPGATELAQQAHRRLFSVLTACIPGLQLGAARVDRTSWRVLFDTPDGEVPIEQLSQGIVSVIAWVGTILRRVHEVYRPTADTKHERALVLIDEIEAHLHPEWQQAIVGILKEHFPGLQVVATTHSPLVVADLREDEVFLSRREDARPGRVSVSRARIAFEGLRADQILTSPLFGLATTRGSRVVDRYAELRGRPMRSEEEARELGELSTRLRHTLANGEHPLDRLAERAVEVALAEIEELQLRTLSSLSVESLSDDVKRRLGELLRGSGEHLR